MCRLILFTLFACIYPLISPPICAEDRPLPMNVILDSQGNPIPIPSENRSALNYSAAESALQSKSQKRLKNSKQKSKSNRAKTVTKTANDPQCRWLSSRLKLLQKNVEQSGNNKRSYHAEELNIRQQEWDCLQCGGNGPAQKDIDRCLHRR